MAPMTRSRANSAGSATALMAQYYAQRASAGLIITEGVQPSVVGHGYPNTPGLHTAGQVSTWRDVTDAVHAAGSRIFAQFAAHRAHRASTAAAGWPDPSRSQRCRGLGNGVHPRRASRVRPAADDDRHRHRADGTRFRFRGKQCRRRRIRRCGSPRRQRLPCAPVPFCHNKSALQRLRWHRRQADPVRGRSRPSHCRSDRPRAHRATDLPDEILREALFSGGQ